MMDEQLPEGLEFLQHLNQAQRNAAMHIDGPSLIIAGAGSGKTRVLTFRIAYLLKSGVDAFHILALTFTNKAAREMRQRIEQLLGAEARNLWMGTFHAVFAKILRIEADKLNFPGNFTIYDTDDSKNLIKDIIKEQGLDDKTYNPQLVLRRISSAKNNLYSWQQYQDNAAFYHDDVNSGKPKLGLLYELYAKRCLKASGMDFDDLLVNMYRLLSQSPEALHKYQHKFKYIMVDEFQDTNYAQYMILKKLAAVYENICVVGDDAQSIYAFRGASIHNILSFEKDYPDAKVFRLEQNYRSSNSIVQVANSLIEKNKNQLKKSVWTSNEAGDKITLMRALSDNEEGVMVAQSIFETKVNQQWKNNNFAILYRTNAQSRSFEEALRKLNIPYKIYGGLSFYKRKEIKDLLAYFRLTLNPNDEEALKRIINVPARGIGKTTMEKIAVAAFDNETSFWEVISNPKKSVPGFNSGIMHKLSEFVTMIQSFAIKCRQENAYDAASHIAASSGLLKELYADKSPEGLSRYENVQELLNGIKEFVETGRSITPQGDEDAYADSGEVRTLQMFMQDISLLTDADEEETNIDTVSLMTIHSAKGLEFPCVFVVGLEENLFPSQLSVHSREDLEEERRLFYVGITRAEKKLVLSYANSRFRWGNLINTEPSRFIEELNKEFLVETGYRSPVFGRALAAIPSRERRDQSSLLRGGAFKNMNSSDVREFTGDDTSLIQVGMEVEHQRFGIGKVLLLEGSEVDRKATIFFQGTGQKMLLLKYARLKIVN